MALFVIGLGAGYGSKNNMAEFTTYNYLFKVVEACVNFSISPEYEKALDILFNCYKRGGTVFTMGCGGSASTATHFSADLAKTTITPGSSGFKTMSLVDNIPLVSAYTNDEGWGSVFSGQLKPWLTDKDVLVGFSVHGGSGEGNAGRWSQNLVTAMKLAKRRGAKIIGFSGFDGGVMKKMADTCLVVPTSNKIYGTPLIESMHVVLAHGLTFDLKEKIR